MHWWYENLDTEQRKQLMATKNEALQAVLDLIEKTATAAGTDDAPAPVGDIQGLAQAYAILNHEA